MRPLGKVAKPVADAVPEVLYHYTTAAGLLGILKRDDNSLWASAIGFSNDTSEGRYATKMGAQILQRYDKAPKASPPVKGSALSPFVPDWGQEVQRTRGWFSSSTKHREYAYSISFCEEDNLLSQWRAYGGVASFSLGFQYFPAKALLRPSGFESRLVKIEYDATKQKEFFRSILDQTRRTFDTQSALFSRLDDNASLTARIASIQMRRALTVWAHSVKHVAFKEEKEWRLIVMPTQGMINQHVSSPDNVEAAEFREFRGRLLPYVRVSPPNGRFDLKSITVGPSRTQMLEVRAVNLFLEKSGLKGVEVNISDTPLQS